MNLIRQDNSSKWIKENIPQYAIQALITHLDSLEFTSEQLNKKWGRATTSEVIEEYYLKKLSHLFTLNESIKDKSVLEFGPGLGITSYLYLILGAKSYCGIEVFGENVQSCRKLCRDLTNHEFIFDRVQDSLDDLLEKVKFDTLSLINVIEFFSVEYLDNLWKVAYDNFDYLILTARFPYFEESPSAPLLKTKVKNEYGRRSLSNDYKSLQFGSIGNKEYYVGALENVGWKIKTMQYITDAHDFRDKKNAIICTK
jgi:hypothetical protein